MKNNATSWKSSSIGSHTGPHMGKQPLPDEVCPPLGQAYNGTKSQSIFNLTLRAQLSLLIVTALCFTVIPILFLTWRNVGSTIIEMEQRMFASVMSAEENNLNSSYQNLLSDKITAIIMRKHQLSSTAHRTQTMLRLLDEDGVLAGKADQSTVNELLQAASSDIIDTSGKNRTITWAYSGNEISRVFNELSPNLHDAKGRSVKQILAGLTQRGDFAVIQLPERPDTPQFTASTDHPVLVFFLPMHADQVNSDNAYYIVSMSPLNDLETAAKEMENEVIRDMQEEFATLLYYPHQTLCLLDSDGTSLASLGEPDMDLLQPYLDLARTNQRTTAYLDSPYGEMIYLVTYIRAFDWFLVIGAPISEIRKPSTHLLVPLLGLCLLGLFITVFFSLALLARSLTPLRTLTDKTRQLPQIDFSSPSAARDIAMDLPLNRSDEIGQLARSFAQMGNALSLNIQNLMAITIHKERMEGELRAARDIQLSILPAPGSAPQTDQLSVAAFLCPAKEVGGDLYDYFKLPDGRYAFVLGDVSDKGVPAALFMSMSITLVRYSLGSGLDAATTMTNVNNLLAKNNSTNMFVTLFLALYDVESGKLEYTNGGHCPPYIYNTTTGSVRELSDLSGPLVGAISDIEYTTFYDTLDVGEVCLVFTDGVTECMNEDKALYGEERLKDFLAKTKSKPQLLLDELYQDLLLYRGEALQSDDITMLSFGRL